ncbi:MAG: hypothetical protein AAFQ98_12850 [Bacteroidota bacterium]
MQENEHRVWLEPAVQDWLQAHAYLEPSQIALQKSPFGERISPKNLAQQLFGWQKAKTKLPTYHSTPGIAYPPALSMEQCSSEQTARWKSQFLKGNLLVDLTAGLGVDSFFLGENFAQLVAVEQQAPLAELAQHNLGLLRKNPFQVHQQIAENYLSTTPPRADWIYLDPARRDAQGGKVFRLADCTPNVVTLLPQLLRYSQHILLKTSPLLDIQQALQDLGGAEKVVVLAVKNEVKELLFFLGENATMDPEITAVDLYADHETHFSIKRSGEADCHAQIGPVQNWLFEPNAAVMKTGAFRSIANQFGLTKLHPNTHLYTGPEIVPGFPGRTYKVLADIAPQKKALKRVLTEDKAMVGVRNFPSTPQQLRQKLGVKDGGKHYLMGYTNNEGQKRLAVMTRQ